MDLRYFYFSLEDAFMFTVLIIHNYESNSQKLFLKNLKTEIKIKKKRHIYIMEEIMTGFVWCYDSKKVLIKKNSERVLPDSVGERRPSPRHFASVRKFFFTLLYKKMRSYKRCRFKIFQLKTL